MRSSEQNPIRVLFVTSQWPTPANPSLAPFVARQVQSLRDAGVSVDVFVYEGGWSLISYVQAVRKMQQVLQRHHYDLIHARFGQCGVVARAQRQVPVVITYGGSDIEGSPHFAGLHRYRNYVLRAISWLLSLLVDEVIVVSDHLGRKLPRSDYHVIPSGVDLSLFQPIDKAEARSRLGLPLDRRLVLFAGDPANRRKRHNLAVQACELASSSIDLDLVVLTGKPSEQVPVYMSACDVLLLTSSNEGSPNVVKEALACNLPVVSVDVGDVRERIGSVNGCVVCDSHEPEVIAEALTYVLKRNKRLASRDVTLEVDIRKTASKVISVYKSILMKRCYGD